MLENTSRKEAEKALAVALQQGQPQVLALLYDTYAPVLLGLISRIVRDSQAVEVVLQETFLIIWQQRATYNAAQCGLLTWMIMVAKETALDAIKTKKFNAVAKSGEIPPTNATAAEATKAHEEEIQTSKSFHQLQLNEKAALDLIYLKGYNCTEAATILGISEENLKLTLRMAIKHLRAAKP